MIQKILFQFEVQMNDYFIRERFIMVDKFREEEKI